jgi:hypothetical protein
MYHFVEECEAEAFLKKKLFGIVSPYLGGPLHG